MYNVCTYIVRHLDYRVAISEDAIPRSRRAQEQSLYLHIYTVSRILHAPAGVVFCTVVAAFHLILPAALCTSGLSFRICLGRILTYCRLILVCNLTGQPALIPTVPM